MNYDPEKLVLWVDELLLVINKPAGLPTLPDGYDPAAPHVRSVFQPAFGRLWVVHRLDKYTSGVLALARSAEAHRSLNTQFDGRQVSKVYHALVEGSPPWDGQTSDKALRKDADRMHRTLIDPLKGKRAVTHLRVLRRLERYTLLEARPETGRTHQIRVHLAGLGFPVAGDRLYGSKAPFPLQTGEDNEWLGLHAWSLAFEHPATQEKVSFQAPYPEFWMWAIQSEKGMI